MKRSGIVITLLAVILTFNCSYSIGENKKERYPQPGNPDKASKGSALKTITHFNIIISPDLSNRLLKPKPISDGQIVNAVLKNIYPTILKQGRSVNQYDVFSTSIISNKLVSQYNVKMEDLKIDFSGFGTQQLNRINYITGKADKNLASDKKRFLNEFNRVSAAAAKSTNGADLWSYFNTGISNAIVLDKGPVTNFNKVSYQGKYRNVMILLTDGYIEASMFGKQACNSGNQCYYLSGQRIKDFRNAFKKSGLNDMQAFFKKHNYGIVPAQNNALKNLEVLVLQMEDRSLNNAGNATVYPTDAEIMQLFWSDWLTKSGVKSFDLKPALASEAETEKVILNFLGIK